MSQWPFAEWIGFMAGLLTTVCYLPQTWHVMRTRKTEGISLISYLTLVGGVFLWFIYGLLIKSWPIAVANGIALPFIVLIIAMKIRLR